MEIRDDEGGEFAAAAGFRTRDLSRTSRSSLLRLCVLYVSLVACAVTGLAQPTPRFVDDDAPPDGDGRSWATAYRQLQNAFDDAGNVDVSQIRVAGGTYTPDQGRAVRRTSRAEAFVLIDETVVLGGFAGWDAPDPNERDIKRFETILSGDLRGDDPEGRREDNSDTIVRTAGVSAAAVLDGVTVTAATGAGVTFTDGSPTLRNCTFLGNDARGVEGRNGTPTIEHCIFIANAFLHNGIGGAFVRDCDVFGLGFTRMETGDLSVIRCRFIDCEFGGLEVRNGNVTVAECLFEGTPVRLRRALDTRADNTVVTNCTFRDNKSGAIRHRFGPMTVQGCVFEGNVAGSPGSDGNGGAIHADRDVTVIDSTFVNNRTGPEGSLGGAIYAAGGPITVIDSSFVNNRAISDFSSYGGAIYEERELTIQGCDFVGNEADWGGAVGARNNPPTVNATNCRFVGNVAEWAGAVTVRAGSFRDCDFIGNTATGTPDRIGFCGAIWAPVVNGSPIEMTNCRFIENSAPLAGAVFMANADVDVSNCEFIRNRATTEHAGALSILGINGSWRNCSFIENTAVKFAGALHIRGSSSEFADCTFERNSSFFGGAVYAESVPSFLNCDFTENNADQGGAIYFLGSQKVVERCRFIGNRAETHGGAIFLDPTSAAIGNSLFAGNSAGVAGGGLWSSDNTTLLIHASTFADNLTAGSGGGLVLAGGSATQIDNSIFWGNRDADGGGEAAQITLGDGAQLSIDYSTIQGITHNLGGIGNIGEDPVFVDPRASDYHLARPSPAIDRGDPDFRAAEGERDIDGDLRIWNDRIDMGADEFRPLGDLNCDGAIDALDIEPFLLALFDPDAYESSFPDCDITLADLNRDDAVDAFDIEPFLRVLFP